MACVRGETMDNYKPQYMEIDLEKVIAEKDVGLIMGTGDEDANMFAVSVKRGGETVNLNGLGVVGYLIMPNDETLRITGNVVDNEACVTIKKAGYVYDGAFQLTIKLVVNGKENTIAIFHGKNARTTSENISDGEKVIYGVKDILNMIDSMEKAEADAKSATTAANSAAESANSAAQSASTIAQTVENKLKAGDFVGEKGDTGATPNITFHVATGEPGTQVQISQSGTAESPVVDLTIPRGDTGAVDGIDYFEGAPSALGTASPGTANGVARGDHVHPMPTAEQVGARPDNWTPTAEDVGARPDSWLPTAEDVGALPVDGTAADASKLGGKLPGEYANAELAWVNATPASEFPPQTVQMDLTSSDATLIEFDFSNGTNIRDFGVALKLGRNTKTCLSMALTKNVARYVNVLDSGLVFGEGMYMDVYGTPITQNTRVIPTRIYKLKGVWKEL